MVNTMEMFAGLADIKIEGIESIAVKCKTIVDQTKKKSYDVLDHRKGEVGYRSLIEFTHTLQTN